MDFHGLLRTEVIPKLRPVVDRRDKVVSEINALRRAIIDGKEYVARIEDHIDGLRSDAGEALLGGQHSYSKYLTSIRGRTTELADKGQEVEDLEAALGRKQEELVQAERDLDQTIFTLARETKATAEAEMRKGLDAAIAVRDQFLLVWERLCSEIRATYPIGKAEAIPGLVHDRIDRASGRVLPLPVEVRALRLKDMPAVLAE